MNTSTVVPAPRVVVIDDTDDLRQLLSLALTRGGFEIVAEAGDGQAGIETVREHRPDVVLLDLAMPVMDGIEALPAIRRLVPTAKIIVLSGFGAQQMSARAVAVGADGYVQKGAPLPSILDYVRTVCAAPAGRSGRALTVVADADAVDSDRVEPATDTDPGERQGGSSEALALAPFGVLELADEPLFRILTVNAVAQRLLGSARPGSPLAVTAPELASMVSYHRLDADASFEADLVGGRARATLRRTGWSVLVYLDSSREDVGVLRRAISTAAQQVRGPVAVLGAIAETLVAEDGTATGPPTPEDRDRWVAAVLRQTRALDSITADLLTSAQIQRGTLRLDLADVEPAAVARRVASEHDLSVAAAGPEDGGVTVTVTDDRAVRADPVRLAQALRTLLSNAHLHGDAPVEVRVRPDDLQPDRVVVEVVDHGPGVDADLVERVFTEFTRGKEGASGGTGLGLYIVRTLLLAMGGEATCGTGPEGGAVFGLHLPAVPRSTAADPDQD